MKISTIIVDDNADFRLFARLYLEKNCPQIIIVAEATSVTEALFKITSHKPDLLLLEISMPDGTGFDLLQNVTDKTFEVIFLTAYNTFAVEAFKYSAVGYLLKPVIIEELKETIARATERIQKNTFNMHWLALHHNLQQNRPADKKLAIPTSTGYVFINVRDIIRCESYSNYTEFNFADGKKMISSRNLGFYEEFLPPEKFCRIHQSHLVNIDFIYKYNKRTNGGTIIMKDGAELDVSQRRKEILFNYVLNK